MIKADQQIGSLQKNMLANFFISNKPIFDKEAIIAEHWISGKKTEVNTLPEADLRGKYTINLKGFDNYMMKIDGDAAKPTITLLGTDTLKANLDFGNNMMNLVFKASKKSNDNIRVNCWIDKTEKELKK